MKKTIAIISIFIISSATLLCVLVWSIFNYAAQSSGNDISEKVITVLPGQHFKMIASQLEGAGIIKDSLRFKLFARFKGYDKRIKAGEYRLSNALSPKQVLEIMVSGKVALYRITIPEGYNLAQIAGIVSEMGFTEEPVFIQSATDPEIVNALGVNAGSLEGYLFPDTYYFPKGLPLNEILGIMVNRFREIFSAEWQERARQMDMSVHQVVTLASIIEKETGAAFERPLIASVFHNRLAKGMRLSSDPTVIYGIKDFNGNLTRKHLTTQTPYNTYLNKGLPPGPIANPGLASLEAALYPAETDFFYFVSKKDSTHQFSTTFKEHNQAVRKYQLRKR
ncbi:MAG: endolytic transglycosylase MltG [Desulfobacterales bacterium]|nr:endolytic transglycosylase MltG [Desulfobacterales bacterium]MDX2510504.1 endolytic transglycosylase MltG [Desulfobacterales bacterium]